MAATPARLARVSVGPCISIRSPYTLSSTSVVPVFRISNRGCPSPIRNSILSLADSGFPGDVAGAEAFVAAGDGNVASGFGGSAVGTAGAVRMGRSSFDRIGEAAGLVGDT